MSIYNSSKPSADRYNKLMDILEDCLAADNLNRLHNRMYYFTLIYGRIHTSKQELLLSCLAKGTMYES